MRSWRQSGGCSPQPRFGPERPADEGGARSVATDRVPTLQFPPAMRYQVAPPVLLLVLGVADERHATHRGDSTAARIFTDQRKGELIIELAPVDLPAGASHHDIAQPPVAMLEVPTSGSISGFRVDVVDGKVKLKAKPIQE